MADTIDHGTLSRLVEAGAVRDVHIVGQSGGWTVVVRSAAYDEWFREQVQGSIVDPRPSVPDDEARAEFAIRKAALRQAGR